MRVLFVTTRQWNPGDEFIMAGVENILRSAGTDIQFRAIYNRSPQVTSYFEKFNFWKMSRPSSRYVNVADFAVNIVHYDNSFKRDTPLDVFDVIVFSGTPEWQGGRVAPLMKRLAAGYDGTVLFLGIGIPNRQLKLDADTLTVMKRAFVSCRNESLVAQLKQAGVEARYLPCPALFSAAEMRTPVTDVRKVGLGFNTTNTLRNQRINQSKYDLQNYVFKKLLDRYDCEIVCHYIDEIEDAAKIYGIDKIRYDFDALGYRKIFASYDMVVSSRVHGCGMASSSGVPNALIAHDLRADTVKGFLSELITSEKEADRFLSLDAGWAAEWSSRLRAHKEQTMARYADVLRPVLGL